MLVDRMIKTRALTPMMTGYGGGHLDMSNLSMLRMWRHLRTTQGSQSSSQDPQADEEHARSVSAYRYIY